MLFFGGYESRHSHEPLDPRGSEELRTCQQHYLHRGHLAQAAIACDIETACPAHSKALQQLRSTTATLASTASSPIGIAAN